MWHRFCSGYASERNMRMITYVNHKLPLPPLDIGRRCTVQRGHAEGISLAKEQIAELGLAEPGRVRQQGLEHALQLAGRAADNLEDLRRRRLLLQCVGKVPSRFREFASAYFELPFQVDESVTPAAHARSIFRAFSRRGQGPASMLDQVVRCWEDSTHPRARLSPVIVG
jgi:hypothetical protein